MAFVPCSKPCNVAGTRQMHVPTPDRPVPPAPYGCRDTLGLEGRLSPKEDREGGATTRLRGFEHQVAVHRPAQLAGHVEAQAAALAGRPLRTALEPLEEPRAIVIRNAGTSVGDRDPDHRRDLVHADLH